MNNIIFETKLLKYTVLSNGQIEGIYDKRDGKNYLDGTKPQYICELYRERAFIERDIHANPGRNYLYIAGPIESTGAKAELPLEVELEDGILKVVFSSFTAEIKVVSTDDCLIFKLLNALPSDVYSMTICRAMLGEFGCDGEDFCVATHSMNINTKPHYYPSPLEHAIGVEVFSEIGAADAEFALCVATRDSFTDVLRGLTEYIDFTKMIVSPRGGAFANLHDDANLSYMIVLDIDDVEKTIEMYDKFGVGQVDFHQSGAFRQGDMRFTDKYHNDATEFRRKVSEPLKAAGKTVSLHTYCQLISTSDTATLSDAKAQKDLAFVESFTLADAVDETSEKLRLNEDVSGVVTPKLYRDRNSPYILVDSEIMKFAVEDGQFSVVRGQCGTSAAPHEKGAEVRHLEHMYFHLASKPLSELFFKIARNTANAYNQGGFSMMYFDGLDSFGLLSPEYAWYYAAAFVLEVLNNCENPPAMEYSIMFPLLWHARSRMGAWDIGHRGFKYFVDRHRKFNQSGAHADGLPKMLGWFNFYPSSIGETYPGKENRILHFDDVDFIGSRALAWDNSTAYQDRNIEKFPKMRDNMLRYSVYESLRVNKYFEQSTLEKLRDDGEYAVEEVCGEYRIRRKHYVKGKLCPSYSLSTLSGNNPFSAQTPFVRIEGLYSVGSTEAALTGRVDDGVRFDAPRDYSQTPCVKINVTGNNSSDKLLVSLMSERYFANTVANYVIPCDFEGQREFIFAENCNGEFNDDDFEGKSPKFYSEYMKLTDYEMLQEVKLYRHGSCDGVTVNSITMVDCQNIPIVDPMLKIGDETLTFRCRLNATDYIEYLDGMAVKYDIYGNGEEIEIEGSLPQIVGDFTASVTAENDAPYRAEVTFGFSGDVVS